MSASIADRFIDAVALIRELDKVSAEDPMRYAVWRAKEAAEMILYNATQSAYRLADDARLMHKEATEDRIAAVKAATPATQGEQHD